jgi:hypothetical protein
MPVGIQPGVTNDKYPTIGPSWRTDWDRLTALFDFPPGIRKAIYATNAHRCDGITELLAAKGAKESRSVSERPIDPKEDFAFRRAERLEEMEPADSRLEGSAQSIRHLIRPRASLNEPAQRPGNIDLWRNVK